MSLRTSAPLKLPLSIARAVQAHGIVERILVNARLKADPQCRTFYTGAEWAARGEKHGTRAVLVVVYDGGTVGAAFNIDRAFEHDRCMVRDDLRVALQASGFDVCEGTHWYSMIYDEDALSAVVKGPVGPGSFSIGDAVTIFGESRGTIVGTGKYGGTAGDEEEVYIVRLDVPWIDAHGVTHQNTTSPAGYMRPAACECAG